MPPPNVTYGGTMRQRPTRGDLDHNPKTLQEATEMYRNGLRDLKNQFWIFVGIVALAVVVASVVVGMDTQRRRQNIFNDNDVGEYTKDYGVDYGVDYAPPQDGDYDANARVQQMYIPFKQSIRHGAYKDVYDVINSISPRSIVSGKYSNRVDVFTATPLATSINVALPPEIQYYSTGEVIVLQDFNFDLERVWESVKDGDFDSFANDETCYFPSQTNKGDVSSGVSAAACNAQVAIECSGAPNYISMCFDSLMLAPSNVDQSLFPYDFTRSHMYHSSLQSPGRMFEMFIDLYNKVESNHTFEAFDYVMQKYSDTLPCWKLLYNYCTLALLTITNDGIIYCASQILILSFEQASKNKKPTPAYLVNVTIPPAFLSWVSTTELRKKVYAIFNNVYESKYSQNWDQIQPYPRYSKSVSCDKIRSKYTNPLGDTQVLQHANKTFDVDDEYNRLKCVFNTEKVYFEYNTSSGKRSFSFTKTPHSSAVGCQVVSPITSFFIEPFNVPSAIFYDAFDQTKRLTTWLKSSGGTFKDFLLSLSENSSLNSINYVQPIDSFRKAGFPLFSANKVVFGVSADGAYRQTTSTTITPLVENITYIVSLVAKDESSGLFYDVSNDVANPTWKVHQTNNTSFEFTIWANMVQEQYVWIQMSATYVDNQRTVKSANAVYIKFCIVKESPTPQFTPQNLTNVVDLNKYFNEGGKARNLALFDASFNVPFLNYLNLYQWLAMSSPYIFKESYEFWATSSNVTNVFTHPQVALYVGVTTISNPLVFIEPLTWDDALKVNQSRAPGTSTPYIMWVSDMFGNKASKTFYIHYT